VEAWPARSGDGFLSQADEGGYLPHPVHPELVRLLMFPMADALVADCGENQAG